MGRIAALLALVLLAAVLVSAARGGRFVRQRPAHYQGWLCVHGKEAVWDDAGEPYFGGLQMGWWFMRTYAARMLRLRGTADHWTPLEQMWVAERAWRRERYSFTWLRAQWPTSYGCL